jgi:hypothetical protein
MEGAGDRERQSAFMSALVTQHLVLQAAANAPVSEAGSRASLYVFALSSSLVAMEFASRSRDVFVFLNTPSALPYDPIAVGMTEQATMRRTPCSG